ncbi:MAG: type II CRISPR-associated endonuclease Cas1 [Bdellovibrionales bacterium]|nr:type II CRISPR-associated endonuclease Cas1 [Bdellovibrionales bacterium]
MSLGHFVEISQPNIYLSLNRGFLEISQQKNILGKIPLDDILGLVITSFGCSNSSNLLVELADRNIPISICGSNFMPMALVFPIVGNVKQKARIQSQVEAKNTLKKRLWKKIVQLKLKNQALVLKENNLNYKALLDMSNLVQSGDPQNLEAQSARRYWTHLFSKKFKRDRYGNDINSLLNYSYTIIRSCTARAVMSVGLHPSLGIHHRNFYNPMCLVDDLMEPFRPLGDYVVKQFYDKGITLVDKEVKKTLSKISTVDMFGDKGQSPLFQIIAQFVYSFSIALRTSQKKWEPKLKIQWNHLRIEKLRDNIDSYSV